MFNIGVISYSAAALMFLVLSLLLLTSWRGRLQGGLLVSAVIATVAWAAIAAYHAASGYPSLLLLPVVEVIRDGIWFAFLIGLLRATQGGVRMSAKLRWLSGGLIGVCLALLGVLVWPEVGGLAGDVDLRVLGYVLLAVAGLGLVEQIFRNTSTERKWGIKFLCLGIGGFFAYDFFLYSDALLFQHVDRHLWDARGVINALAVPLIAVSAARNPQWSLDVAVSRGVVFHTTALLGAGIYLLVMAGAGYYIRLYGGSWGMVAQAIFLFGAAVVLLVILSSGQARARWKVLLNKHFFSHKYDYREEWLRFIRTLSGSAPDSHQIGPARERTIKALAQIVDSPAGMLWWRRGTVDSDSPFVSQFMPAARWNVPQQAGASEPDESSLADFLEKRQWVIDLGEYARHPEIYQGLEMPSWLRDFPQGWLVVPLVLHQQVPGFMVLTQPRAARHINWEDRDLLKTAGCQAASYLAQLEAAQALVEARQFEAFNRLSAFVVHDLKNLVAQLSLVVSNAARHKHNPAFMEDAINTVEHATAKMNRLLAQLRSGSARTGMTSEFDLDALLREVVAMRAHAKPAPVLERSEADLFVQADRDRLAAVFVHLVQNAQEATPADGYVRIRLSGADGQAVLEVEDSGHGMSAEFIRERLFQPFQTTKGGTGMGIGVYQSRELVRDLGGEIQVTSTPGKGTLFRILLPLKEVRRDVKILNGL
ncbi:MAG: PEP-CTERM system histidine kinase PrsK [Gammaproteobacteria bacterium]|nr:PEP-CTERM system histidine kinase PrsK [Gammaproteobacteria bacterium]